MLRETTFYLKLIIIFLYREIQQLYIELKKTLNVSFKTYIKLEILNSLAICLLMIDDSYKEVYNDKEFVNFALSERHKNINVI